VPQRFDRRRRAVRKKPDRIRAKGLPEVKQSEMNGTAVKTHVKLLGRGNPVSL
jgi:hypothetical protein